MRAKSKRDCSKTAKSTTSNAKSNTRPYPHGKHITKNGTEIIKRMIIKRRDEEGRRG